MNIYEMEGFLHGKCMPRDILVNESTAEYLVRKLNEATTVKAERDALAVANSMYREAIRTARRLINVDEMGDADVVLAKAERSISSNAAAVREIEARAIKSALDSCVEYYETDCVMDRLGISYDDAELRTNGALELYEAMRAYAAELLEGK
ncbi:hypothetical protein [Serratia rubidaea]|uniref:hypothetical protein n=1 Tax=Serratia rubidaea TaxID=61652 RepID=UPI0022B90220|nr:hypothetical protein [Serratia rubidaea]WBF44474.1 hypothetical protein OLD77_17780 [Serratia rubidaea]